MRLSHVSARFVPAIRSTCSRLQLNSTPIISLAPKCRSRLLLSLIAFAGVALPEGVKSIAVDAPAAIVPTTVQAEATLNESSPRLSARHYGSNYGNFQSDLYAQIRREAFGDDIGQNSWLTSGEQDRFLQWLQLSPGHTLLDVACGAGGPALRIAATTGCSIIGIDLHQPAITTANSLAAQRDLAQRARFQCLDAAQPFPFPDAAFDAITCIDAINHLAHRPRILNEWARLLKPGGRLLFTNPTTVTGPLTSTDIAARSAAGFYVFVPPGYDDEIIQTSGLQLLHRENLTENIAAVAAARCASRASHNAELREIEGDQAYEDQQEFLFVAARLAQDGLLSRYVYVAKKTG